MAKNMYEFVDKRWNPVRGKCVFDCSYCYTKQWGLSYPLRLDKKVLNENLGSGKMIFICSGCDLFAPDVPIEWVYRVIEQTRKYRGNNYLWHTKNPSRLISIIDPVSYDIACVTIESNRYNPAISKAESPGNRINDLLKWYGKKMITIEPIMDFDLDIFTRMIREVSPYQVNIGADSRNCNLPEPSKEKIIALICELEKFTTVHKKTNLDRLLRGNRA